MENSHSYSYSCDNYNSRNKPVVFILGPTGVGKTKVSLRLAKLLKGEIINSDAFSLYKGADILTTKASLDERNLVNHHMIDILSLTETNFKIHDYVKNCDMVVNQLLSKVEVKEEVEYSTIPVIVGGTNYYVQAILFDKIENDNQLGHVHHDEANQKHNIMTQDIQDEKMKNIFTHIEAIKKECLVKEENLENNPIFNNDLFNSKANEYLSSLDEEILLQILKHVDFAYYTFLHKNDTRRVHNAIIYYLAYGKKKSDKISKEYIKLKYPNSVIVFLNPIVKEPFFSRLENRVDEIIEQNGLVEIFRILNLFYNIHGENLENQFDKGILQAIGYKEFYPIFDKLNNMGKLNSKLTDNVNILSTVEGIKNLISENNLDSLFLECRKKHISNTVNYAKSQLKFIKNRLLPYIKPSKVIEIKINEFTIEKYDEYISNAFEAIQNIIKENSMRKTNEINNIEVDEIQEKLNKISLWEKYYCEVCKSEINGKYENESHLKSNKHKKRKKKSGVEKIKIDKKDSNKEEISIPFI